MIKNEKLETAIAKTRNTIKSDRLDMSFGEIMNLYEDEELMIAPEYQRAFRWSQAQKTLFIESILLGIPVPPIFVVEAGESRWELVDGLQRVATILSFFGKLKDPLKNNLVLNKGDIISGLLGIDCKKMPVRLLNTIRRSFCRVEILRGDSSLDMRYELFSRLNTTSNLLTAQEIRNCIFRSDGNNFNQQLKELAADRKFKEVVALSEKEYTEMFAEELVLRVFCFQRELRIIESLPKHLTEFMRNVIKEKIDFDSTLEKEKFLHAIAKLKKDDLRVRGSFSVQDWDGIMYVLMKANEIDEASLAAFLKEIKSKLDIASVNSSVAHKDRPKKCIEIACIAAKEQGILIDVT